MPTSECLTTSSLALAILENATGNDRATVDAKIDGAGLFTLHLDTSVEIMAYAGPGALEIGRNFIDGITAAALATDGDVDNIILALSRSGGQFEAGEVRDQPVLTMTTLAPLAEGGSRLITQADLLAGATDPQGLDLMALHLELIGEGDLLSNGDGTWTFTAAPGDHSEVTFSYVVTNSWSLPVATTAQLDLTPVGLPPVPAPIYWEHHRIACAPEFDLGGKMHGDIGATSYQYDFV